MPNRSPPTALALAALTLVFGSCYSLGVLSRFGPESPFLWIFCGWAVIFGALSLVPPRTGLTLLFLNLAVLCACLGLAEGVETSRSRDGLWFEGSYSRGFFVDDPLLGYAPAKDAIVQSRRYSGPELLYDVSYTTDSNGLRRAPAISANLSGCALFFGGSFVFGEGVDDHEVAAFIAAQQAEQQFFNFGCSGYGPHQMLAAIESGRVQEVAHCEPKTVVYQALLEHAKRVAGRAHWDTRGPRYGLTPAGVATRLGRFDDGWSKWWKLLHRQAERSRLAARVLRQDHIHESEVDLLVAIVRRSRDLLVRSFPGLAFHVLLWDETSHDPRLRQLASGLEDRDIRVHLISEILPGYIENRERYRIRLDHHPNVLAHRLIGHYLAERVLRESAGTDAPPDA